MLRPIIANMQRQYLFQRIGALHQSLAAGTRKNYAGEQRLSLDTTTELTKYTPEETAHILKVMNHREPEELVGYKLSKGRAQKLVAWRARNGPLQSLQDVLRIDGFSLPVVHKLYQNLLKSPENSSSLTNSKQRTRTTSFIMPGLDIEQQLAIRSVVALRIGVSSITWARVELPPLDSSNTPCGLTHWQYQEITEKKVHISDLVQRCLYINHLIPAADCYVFENPQVAHAVNPGNAAQQNISIQKAQITAMLSYALSARSSKLDTQKETRINVFYLRRFLTARLFNQLIGTECVSSEATVLQLMRTHYNINENQNVAAIDGTKFESTMSMPVRCNVQFPEELRQTFAQADRVRREFLGQALLINLAFVRLILLQDPSSVASVTRNNKKDQKDIHV